MFVACAQHVENAGVAESDPLVENAGVAESDPSKMQVLRSMILSSKMQVLRSLIISSKMQVLRSLIHPKCSLLLTTDTLAGVGHRSSTDDKGYVGMYFNIWDYFFFVSVFSLNRTI